MTETMDLAVFDPIKACTEEVQKKDAALDIDHTTPDHPPPPYPDWNEPPALESLPEYSASQSA